MPGIREILNTLRGSGMSVDDVAKGQALSHLFGNTNLQRKLQMAKLFGNMPDKPKIVGGPWEGATSPLTKAYPEIPMPPSPLGGYRPGPAFQEIPPASYLPEGTNIENKLREKTAEALRGLDWNMPREPSNMENYKAMMDRVVSRRRAVELREKALESVNLDKIPIQEPSNEFALTSKPKVRSGMVKPKRPLTQEQFKALHEAWLLPIQKELGAIKQMPEQAGMPAMVPGPGDMGSFTPNRRDQLSDQARKIMGVMAQKFEPPTANAYSRMRLNTPNPAEESMSRDFPQPQPGPRYADMPVEQAQMMLRKNPGAATPYDMPKMPITRIGWANPGEYGEIPGTGMRFEKARFKQPYNAEEMEALQKTGVLPIKGEMPEPADALIARPKSEQKIADVVMDAVHDWSMLSFVKGKGGAAGRILKDFFEKVFKTGRTGSEKLQFDTPLEYFSHNMAKFKLGKIPEGSRLYPFLQSAHEYSAWVQLNMEQKYDEAGEVMKNILARNPGLFRKEVPPGFEDVFGQFSKERFAERLSKIEEERKKINAKAAGPSKTILRKAVHATPEVV